MVTKSSDLSLKPFISSSVKNRKVTVFAVRIKLFHGKHLAQCLANISAQ